MAKKCPADPAEGFLGQKNDSAEAAADFLWQKKRAAEAAEGFLGAKNGAAEAAADFLR